MTPQILIRLLAVCFGIVESVPVHEVEVKPAETLPTASEQFCVSFPRRGLNAVSVKFDLLHRKRSIGSALEQHELAGDRCQSLSELDTCRASANDCDFLPTQIRFILWPI